MLDKIKNRVTKEKATKILFS